MPCSPQTFTVSPAAYTDLETQARAAGLDIEGDIGQAVYSKCTISWNYNRAMGVLTMQCIDKPWYYPESSVNSRIAGWVNAAVEQAGK